MNNDIFVDLIDQSLRENLHIRNVAIAKDGIEIANHNFKEDQTIQLWSVSKSITSLAIGIAIGEGYLKLDDDISKFLEDKYQEYKHFTNITIRDLLSMVSGHARCPIERAMECEKQITDIVRMFYEEEFVYIPGQHFVYDNTCVYMLSYILTMATGTTLEEYCEKHLFIPLDISNAKWDSDENGISLGFIGLHLNIHDLVKIGIMLLNHGVYKGRIIVPSDYVIQATRKQVSTKHFDTFFATEDHKQGYGYLFWINSYHNSYRMDGMYGQYVVMLPDKNSVVAYLSEEPEKMTNILELTWDTLIDKL
jgi:CubicO group peptidase (beta-lactamase class C family)